MSQVSLRVPDDCLVLRCVPDASRAPVLDGRASLRARGDPVFLRVR